MRSASAIAQNVRFVVDGDLCFLHHRRPGRRPEHVTFMVTKPFAFLLLATVFELMEPEVAIGIATHITASIANHITRSYP